MLVSSFRLAFSEHGFGAPDSGLLELGKAVPGGGKRTSVGLNQGRNPREGHSVAGPPHFAPKLLAMT